MSRNNNSCRPTVEGTVKRINNFYANAKIVSGNSLFAPLHWLYNNGEQELAIQLTRTLVCQTLREIMRNPSNEESMQNRVDELSQGSIGIISDKEVNDFIKYYNQNSSNCRRDYVTFRYFVEKLSQQNLDSEQIGKIAKIFFSDSYHSGLPVDQMVSAGIERSIARRVFSKVISKLSYDLRENIKKEKIHNEFILMVV